MQRLVVFTEEQFQQFRRGFVRVFYDQQSKSNGGVYLRQRSVHHTLKGDYHFTEELTDFLEVKRELEGIWEVAVAKQKPEQHQHITLFEAISNEHLRS